MLSHWLPPWFVAPFNWGTGGVYLFFVISGYVITRILLSETAGPVPQPGMLGRFYARRALRIWPVYFLVCAITFFVWPKAGQEYAAWHFAFLSNVLVGRLGELVYPVHFWSLSVEQHFYLVWPVLVLVLPRRYLPALCLAFVAVSPLARLYFLAKVGNLPLMLTATVSNLDTLAMGALLATQERRLADPARGARTNLLWKASGIAGALLMTLIVLLRLSGRPELGFVLGGTSVALLSAWLIRCAAVPRLRRVLSNPATLYLGTISYGIYLYHILVGSAVAAIWPGLAGSYAFVVVASVVTVLIATVSWFGIERPILRLKAKLR